MYKSVIRKWIIPKWDNFRDRVDYLRCEMLIPFKIGNTSNGFSTLNKKLILLPVGHRKRGDIRI